MLSFVLLGASESIGPGGERLRRAYTHGPKRPIRLAPIQICQWVSRATGPMDFSLYVLQQTSSTLSRDKSIESLWKEVNSFDCHRLPRTSKFEYLRITHSIKSDIELKSSKSLKSLKNTW